MASTGRKLKEMKAGSQLTFFFVLSLAARAHKAVAHIVGEFSHLSSFDRSTPSMMYPDIYPL